MSNSPLATYTLISPNKNSPRNKTIDRITPHCVVGQASAKRICEIFQPTSREASCNYAIGYDGQIGLCVDEKDRSWCSSSGANDHRAITIEIASDTAHPYAMNDKAYEAFLDLATDICKRNGKSKLLWISDKTTALAYSPKADEMLLTVHRWFANKSCPGDWLYSRLGDVAKVVTERLQNEKEDQTMTNEIICPCCGARFVQTDAAKEPETDTAKDNTLKVGDMVRLEPEATVYGKATKFSGWVYNTDLYVRQISGDRIVISTLKTGAVTGAVDVKYLVKVG